MKHIHAELMMEYAKDAMETDKPWERWEFNVDNKWESFRHGHPLWEDDTLYRRKPKTITINGHEVPEPYRGEMRHGQFYHIPNLEHSDHCTELNWLHDGCDRRVMEGGLVHLTKEAAIKHTEALLSFTSLS